MKTKSSKKFPSALLVTAIVAVLALAVTFAGIFSNTVSIDGLFKLSNFKATGNVYFEGVSNMSAYTDEYGVKASLNSTDPNYIGNLRVNVDYAGCGVGLVRVRLIEEWSTTVDGVRFVKPFAISVPYIVSDSYTDDDEGNAAKWYDNRENDYRFYYATAVHNTGDRAKTLALVSGIDTDAIDLEAIPEGTDLHVIVETDIVQVNRYPQYWKITSLPWVQGVSATEVDINA